MTMIVDATAAAAAASRLQSRCAAGHGRYANPAGKFTTLRAETFLL